MAKYLKTEQGYIDASIFAPASFKPEGKSYLTFSSLSSFTLKVNNATKNWDGTLEYFSADKVWTVWDGTTILFADNNDGEYVLYLRGTGNTKITGLTANGSSDTYRWVLTGSDIACVGNIENLLDYATVESGQHPTMAEACYVYMFFGCTSLTQAPTLTATTLADYCYCGMFVRCTSLTQAPVLPAITLSKGCYQDMFFGCTSLTQAPTLTATTLADYCYADMFYGCTSLTQAPALSATTLSSHCYRQMFSSCTSLTQTPALPATTLANDCYYYMFHDCTSLTKAPALPATTLAKDCYQGMFSGCTSLTQVPALPATNLATYCYNSMFKDCTGLKLSSTQTSEYTVAYRIPTTGSGSAAENDIHNMFASTGGTFTGTPQIDKTYYLSTDNMIVRDTEVATLNGYVGSMIDNAIGEYADTAMSSNNPVGTGSFSMGRKAGSTIGISSHAEGFDTTASGENSHAEGFDTTASGGESHAEGHATTASGENSHAEGFATTASGENSHAEGYCTNASAKDSHAEGYFTTAKSNYQHVQGICNVADSSNKYAHIVGNGRSMSARSNAHTLDWNGVPWFKGRPQFGGTEQDQGSQTVMANGDKEIILTSSTADSTKKFKITVDDSGALTATEITQ